jgi:hypothetical protein
LAATRLPMGQHQIIGEPAKHDTDHRSTRNQMRREHHAGLGDFINKIILYRLWRFTQEQSTANSRLQLNLSYHAS